MIKGVETIVDLTGNERLAQRLRSLKSVEEATNKAATWFKGRKGLFLINDIWWLNGIDYSVLSALGTMAHDNCCLVYTTRDQKFVTSAHEVINFGSRDPVVARRMLLRHAGSHGEGSLSGNNKDAFEAILRMCNGLPPALGIAGSSVLEISAGHECKLDMWTTYLRDFVSEDLTSGSFDAYGDLTKIVGISLKVLSHRAERDDDEERLQHTGGDKH